MKLLVLLSVLGLVYGATDYCSTSLCPGQGTHIACKHSGAFSSSCPSDAKLVDLTSYIPTILASHNEKRNQIASGKLTGFKAASRMATMQWDNEMAAIAALNVKQCVMQHDQCRSTSTFLYAGQNLGEMGYSGPVSGFTDEDIIKRNIDAWFDEYKNAKASYLAKYPINYTGATIGHFTVLVAEANVKTGCAASRYTQDGFNYFLIACNYATTNFINEPIYVAGTAASGCKTGTNSTYTSLCSTSETY